MPVNDTAIMNNIQQLSSTLSTQQLEQFVEVIESLAALLQVANKDTEKAYRLYLNSIEANQEEAQMNAHLMPIQYGAVKTAPLKH